MTERERKGSFFIKQKLTEEYFLLQFNSETSHLSFGKYPDQPNTATNGVSLGRDYLFGQPMEDGECVGNLFDNHNH